MSLEVELAWQNVNASLEAKTGPEVAASLSVLYIVSGTDDDFEALRATWAKAEEKKEGLVKTRVVLEERSTRDTWKVRVEYSDNAQASDVLDGDEEVKHTSSFSTGGGTQHIETSISTPGQFWDATVYPNGREYPGCIEPDIDGNPRGLDIPAPVFKFSETHYFKSSKTTTSFKKKLAYATRCMNARPFRGFEPGEVLFLGVSGSQDSTSEDSPWALTYEFAVQMNQTNLVIGNITVPTKYGWDYLWKYIESRTDLSGKVFKRITGVFVERIYTAIDFNHLGI